MFSFKKGDLQKIRSRFLHPLQLMILAVLMLLAVVYPQRLLAALAAVDSYVAEWAIAFGGRDAGEAASIGVDSASNVYTAGYFQNAFDFGGGDNNPVGLGQRDIFIAKTDKDGGFVWAKAIGSSNIDEAKSMAVDGNGDAYVTGRFRGTADFDPNAGVVNRSSVGDDDIFVMKLDANGALVWANTFGGITTDEGYGIGIGVNSVVATGFFSGTTDFDPANVGSADVLTSTAASRDIFVANYNSADGAFKWVNYVAGIGFNDRGDAADIDAAGNVYVTGYFGNADTNFNPKGTPAIPNHGSNRDVFVVKYDPNGAFQWVYAAGGTGSDVGNAIVVDDADNVYITGSFENTVDFDPDPDGAAELISAGSDDIFLVALKSNGAFNWAKRIGGVGSDQATGLALDDKGRLHVAGSFSSNVDFDPGDGVTTLTSLGATDAFAIILSIDGDLEAAGQMGGVGSEVGRSIAVDDSGIYVAGSFDGVGDYDPSREEAALTPVGSTDIFVVKLQQQAITGSAVGKALYLPVIERN
ncbi:MAG: SBBP repeat-containing protein [Caldilineaceae bacterium]